MARRTWIEGAHVVDPRTGEVHRRAGLLIRDGLIDRIGAQPDPGEPVIHVDGTDRFAVPGFFESHAHLGWLEAEPEEGEPEVSREDALAGFLRAGVTQVRDVGGPLERMARMRGQIESGTLRGPELFYAGPMLEHSPLHWAEDNLRLPGFTEAIDTPAAAEAMVERLAAGGARLVKTFFRQDPEVFRQLLARAAEAGLRVVHDPGPPLFQSIPIRRALDLGVRGFEHGTNPLQSVLKDELQAEHDSLHREDGPEIHRGRFYGRVFRLGQDAISREKLDRLIHDMAETRSCLCPTLRVFRPRSPGEEDAHEFRSAMRATARYFTAEMVRDGVRILVGQDGMIPRYFREEVEELADCGLSGLQILRGATLYPAEWLGVADRLGNLRPGWQADVVLLERDPREDPRALLTVHDVLQRGRPVPPEPRGP